MVEFEKSTIQLAFPTPSKLFTPFVTTVLALMIIGYAVAHYATVFTQNQLCISTSVLLRFKVWQFLTYPFINIDPRNMAFNCFVVLFVGSTVEREWKTISLVMLWLVVSVVCGLIWVFISFIFRQNFIGHGTDSCVYGLIAAFGILYRKRRFIFFFWPAEAQVIALLVIAIGVVIGIAHPMSWIWIMGALVSYLYIKFIWQWIINSPSKVQRSENTRGSGFVDLD